MKYSFIALGFLNDDHAMLIINPQSVMVGSIDISERPDIDRFFAANTWVECLHEQGSRSQVLIVGCIPRLPDEAMLNIEGVCASHDLESPAMDALSLAIEPENLSKDLQNLLTEKPEED